MAIEHDLNVKIGSYKTTCEKLRIENSNLMKKLMIAEESNKHSTRQGVIEELENNVAKLNLEIDSYKKKIKQLELTVQKQCEERMELLAELSSEQKNSTTKISGNDSDIAFPTKEVSRHRTLKLLDLEDTRSQTSHKSVSISKKSQESYHQDVSYLPQSLADLTKQQQTTNQIANRQPLPNINTPRKVGPNELGTGFKVTVGLQSQRNANFQSGENIMAKTNGTNSISGSLSNKNIAGDNPMNNGRYRAIPKSELRSSQKATSTVRSGSNVNEDSDVDTLRRKIRLAIRQRQRKEKS